MAAMSVSNFPASIKLFIFVNLIIIIILFPGSYVKAGLYNQSDHILLLDASNFESSVIGQNEVLVTEFYNSWCGHCVRYAPIFIEFAKDLKTWTRVVKVAAIDCADENSSPICSRYDIRLFPSLKIISPGSTIKDLGMLIPHEINIQDVNILRHYVIDYVTSSWKSGRAEDRLIRLTALSENAIEDIWKSLPPELDTAQLIYDTNQSYIGREVILDVSWAGKPILRFNASNLQLLKQVQERATIPNKELPALLQIIKNSQEVQVLWLASDMSLAREEFRSAIYTLYSIGAEQMSKAMNTERTHRQMISVNSGESDDRVHMVDLENALHYSLHQEVTMKPILEGKDLRVFKAFLAALTKLFPGSDAVMQFLNSLYSWTTGRNQIESKTMLKAMNDMESKSSYIPPMREYVHCQGSSPRYRGYPCALWTLFHTMTVQAHQKYLLNNGEMVNPQQVLFTLRDYVIHFFTCTECARHFQQMSTGLESELPHPNSTVLWLWGAHNKVNLRLSKDPTEDPMHPKIQFPSLIQCPNCYSEETKHFILTPTLAFLSTFYLDIVPTEYKHGSALINKNSWKYPSLINGEKGWSSSASLRYFSGVDISLCVLLYLTSAILLEL